MWIGLGSLLFAKNPQRALDQIDLAHSAGSHGDALFSWDSIADHPALRDALALQVSEEREDTEPSEATDEHETQ